MPDKPEADLARLLRLTPGGRLASGKLGDAAAIMRRALENAPRGMSLPGLQHPGLRTAGLHGAMRLGGADEVLGRVLGQSGAAERHPGAPPRGPEVVPPGGRFDERRCAIGGRAYKLYTPGAYHGQPLPLLIMLHGCTQTPDDFAAGTRMNLVAEAHDCFVAYPDQPNAANPQRCWNWFKPADQVRGGGEPGSIAAIVRELIDDRGIDRGRVYVAGLSAGGAAAAIMAKAYADLFAAAGVHSGLACGAAHDLHSALAAMRDGHVKADRSPPEAGRRVPMIVFHGDADTIVHPQNAEGVVGQALGDAQARLQLIAQHGRAPQGHAYTRHSYAAADGNVLLEEWIVHEGGHAWFGGSTAGSFTDPRGPDASREMMRFFLRHRLPG